MINNTLSLQSYCIGYNCSANNKIGLALDIAVSNLALAGESRHQIAFVLWSVDDIQWA